MAKLTAEHLWSAWIGRVLGKSKYACRQRGADGSILKQWTRPGLDMKPKAVCRECNNGWMSKLENSAKPAMADMIVNGTRASLDSSKIELIARFAFKTAVIADSTAKGRNPFLPALYEADLRSRSL